MKNFSIIALAVCCLLVAGGGCFSNNGSTESTDAGTTSNASGTNDESWIGNFADALKLGQSMRCTWSSPDGEGETYIKGEQVYTETRTNGTIAYMISDGECSYMWEAGASEGVQICAPEVEYDESDYDESDFFDDSYDDDYDTSPDPDVDMNCSVTNVSDSLFSPPTGVNFVDPFADLSGFLEGLEGLDF